METILMRCDLFFIAILVPLEFQIGYSKEKRRDFKVSFNLIQPSIISKESDYDRNQLLANENSKAINTNGLEKVKRTCSNLVELFNQ